MNSLLRTQKLSNPQRSAFAIGHGVDNLTPAVDAIASGKIPRVGRLPRCAIDRHAALLQLKVAALAQELDQRRLPDCRNDQIALQMKAGVRNSSEFAVIATPNASALNCGKPPIAMMDRNRNGLPMELDPLLLRMFVFMAERRNVPLFAAIQNMHFIGAQALGRVGGVDRGVPRSNHDHLAAYRDGLAGLVTGDELQSIDDFGMFFTGNAQLVHRAQPN